MLNPDNPLFSSSSDPSSATPFVPPRAAGELIMVVDDQEDIRDLLATVLGSHGYRTVLAVDGDHAVTVFKGHAETIAAVITDLHMPHTEGGSLADLLRQLRADIPILFMSGLNESASGHDSKPATSRDPFLLKPFRPAALLEAIHRLLRSRRSPNT